jgi:DNA-binding response OmpR family regulator
MAVLKIGIIEDELVIARTIISTLEELGYNHCGPAINYTEALNVLDIEKPDLVLLDIQLAGRKNGFDVAEVINEKYKIPFIFLSANSDVETNDRAKIVKPNAYIIKPFNKEGLYAAIEIAFSNFNPNAGGAKSDVAKVSVQGRNFMFVKDGYLFRKIFFDDLIYLKARPTMWSCTLNRIGRLLYVRQSMTLPNCLTLAGSFVFTGESL